MPSRLAALIVLVCAIGCSARHDGSGAGNAGGAGHGGTPSSADGGAIPGSDGGGPGSDGGGPGSDDGGPGGDDGGVAPGSGIDWSPWTLQEPDGRTQDTLQGYEDSYFHRDGSRQAFIDTMTGTTTSGSLHPRCELREKISWLAAARNTLAVTGRVTQLGGGAAGKTTVGQVFNADGSIPLAELIYLGSGKFEVLYEEAKGAGTYTPSNVSAALGSDYTFELALSGGQLTVTVDGTTIFTKTPSAAVANDHFYFKAGDYDQTAMAGATSTVPYTIVEASAIHVAHQ